MLGLENGQAATPDVGSAAVAVVRISDAEGYYRPGAVGSGR